MERRNRVRVEMEKDWERYKGGWGEVRWGPRTGPPGTPLTSSRWEPQVVQSSCSTSSDSTSFSLESECSLSLFFSSCLSVCLSLGLSTPRAEVRHEGWSREDASSCCESLSVESIVNHIRAGFLGTPEILGLSNWWIFNVSYRFVVTLERKLWTAVLEFIWMMAGVTMCVFVQNNLFLCCFGINASVWKVSQ